MNGSGWLFIRSFAKGKNGRKPWKALAKHYLGAGPVSTEKQKAYATIKSAKYTGESARYTFETYVSSLQNAYETLAEFDEPVAEAKKVQDFRLQPLRLKKKKKRRLMTQLVTPWGARNPRNRTDRTPHNID